MKSEDGKGTLQYRITCTEDFEKACNFYLKPFEEKYFLIATDPEDMRITEQLQEVDTEPIKSQPALATDPEESCTPIQPMTEDQPEATAYKPPTAVRVYKRVPQRFVHLHREGGQVHLSAEMVIDKKTAGFKLKYPHKQKSHQTLSKSQWLPEAALGSEPYFVYLRGSSFLHRNASVLSVGKDTDGKYIITGRGSNENDNIDKQLFVLMVGHKT